MGRDWDRILSDFRGSGESQADYSRRTGVSASELSKRLRSRNEEGLKGSFIRLDKPELKLDFGGGLVARMPLTSEVLKLLLSHASGR